MGSTSVPQQADAPQHPFPPPAATRLAASPYFSRTISLTLFMNPPSGATHDPLGLNCLVARAALGVQKSKQFFEPARIGGIPQVGPFAADAHELFVLEFLQMVR